MNGNLPIKTERDVERRLRIKSEPKETKLAPVAIPNTWQVEKRTLVDKIVALKSENHHNVINLKRTQSELSKLLFEKQTFEKVLAENAAISSEEIKKLKSELSSTKNEILKREKTNSDLKRENQTLTARINQYKTGLIQQKIVDNGMPVVQNEDQEYEVESILDHKTSKSGRQYLIRWKGFDSTEDSWQKESNLNCPKLLRLYNRSIKSKEK